MGAMKKEMVHVKDMKRKLEHRESVERGGRFRMEGNNKRKDGSQERCCLSTELLRMKAAAMKQIRIREYVCLITYSEQAYRRECSGCGD